MSKTATLHGREHIVAPLTMIVPGVLNGSKGALHYPQEELERNPSAWNGMPILVGHPTVDGNPVSARDPSVLDRYEIGRVFNTKANGKLTAEGWFDVDLVRRRRPQLLADLRAGRKLELSTGLFTDNEPAPPGSSYDYVARNYRPDHLAVLPDGVGACSIAHGCGVNNCLDEAMEWVENELAKIRAKNSVPDEDDILPWDGKYTIPGLPVPDEDDILTWDGNYSVPGPIVADEDDILPLQNKYPLPSPELPIPDEDDILPTDGKYPVPGPIVADEDDVL